MKTVLVTSIQHDFDRKLAASFAREGFNVFAITDEPIEGVTSLPWEPAEAARILRDKAGKLDYLLDTTDIRDPEDTFTLEDGINSKVIERVFRQNIVRSMALLEAFLPLLDQGDEKRLFYVTSESASINETWDTGHFGYNMGKAALHQFIQMTRNKLAPKGYTFRVYDPMPFGVSPETSAESAYHYITRRRGTENHDPNRDDEDNLVFRDAMGRQHVW
jgi:NAD(P)-dependent dehydrogenase (short-subunit alcohol dehydrogenase family)